MIAVFFVTFGDRHPVSSSRWLLSHLFHYGDWDLCFFPVRWGFLFVAEVDTWLCHTLPSLCATDFLFTTPVQIEGPLSPVLAFFRWLCFAVFLVVFCLDEDCIPGWGECGRPLRR